MKIKLLCVAVLAALIGLAAWYEYCNGNAKPATDNPTTPQLDPAEPAASEQPAIPAKYHQTVSRGLEYLVKHQLPDGHWEGDGGRHPVAMTGLVGLALLMERDGQVWGGIGRPLSQGGKYEVSIRKAADWLMEQSQPRREGLIFSEHPSEITRYMEGHGLATLFLAGVCQGERDITRRKTLTDFLTRAAKYTAKAQSSQGGWYHTSKREGHDFAAILPTVMQIQALQAAQNAGIAIRGTPISSAREYLKNAMIDYKPEPTSSWLADTAAALAGRYERPRHVAFGEPLNALRDEFCKRWLKDCDTEIPIGPKARLGQDESAHYYYAQALFKLEGDAWTRYRTAMFDRLQSCQNEDGSWPAGNGISVGRTYSTAVWCTVLQLDNGSHPSRQLGGVIVTTTAFAPGARFGPAATSNGDPRF